MKLGSMRVCNSYTLPIFHKWHKPPLSANRPRPIFSSLISSPPTSLKPQIPLFLRPPTHPATFSDLKKWQDWAQSLSISVGSTFVDSDNGPDTNLLRRELEWLIEDAVEDYSLFSPLGTQDSERPIRLRTCLEELYLLWKQRIEERRPFQYIVGCEHWRDLVLSVQEGVLIPRPETEMVVDLVSKNKRLREGLWADLGTGSGAIAIGIGRILGSCGKVIATDISPVAVAVASFNVERYGLQDKIEIRQGSWFEPLKDVEGKLVGLVSNPPYIPSDHVSGLQAEVGRHEPRLALDGGVNGTDYLLHLCHKAASMLKPGGYFCFEDLMTGKTIGGGCESRGLYYFNLDGFSSSATLHSSVSPMDRHCRLEHPSLWNLNLLVLRVVKLNHCLVKHVN